MKRFIIFLLVFYLAFASSSYETVHTFTTNYDGIVITTDVHLSNGLRLSVSENIIVSGDPNYLQDGDVICPGLVTLNPDENGLWADDDFDGYSTYYINENYIPYVHIVTPHNIVWLSQSQHNQVLGEAQTNEDDIFVNPVFADSAWLYNMLGPYLTSTYSEPFSYKHSIFASGFDGTNKLGYANVFCWGQYSMGINGATIENSDAGFADVHEFTPNIETVNFQSMLKNVECFAAMMYPINAPKNDLLTYRRNILHAPTLRDTMEITVVDPATLNLDFSYLNILNFDGYSPPYEFIESNGYTQILLVTVQNNGNIPAIIDKASITPNTFSFAGPYDAEDPITWANIDDTFIIDRNEQVRLGFIVTYAGVASDLPDHLTLTLDFTTPNKVCGMTLQTSLPIHILVNNSGNGINYTCWFVPDQKTDMIVNTQYELDLLCSDGEFLVPYVVDESELEPRDWTIDTYVFPPLPPANPIGKFYITPHSAGCGKLTADTYINGNLGLTTAVAQPLCANNSVANHCDLTCPACGDTVEENQTIDINIDCYENGSIVTCNNVNWTVTSGNLVSSSDSILTITPDDSSSISVSADAGYEDKCTYSKGVTKKKTCEVNLKELYPDGFGTFIYNVTCFEGDTEIDCSEATEGLDNDEWEWEINIFNLDPHFEYDEKGTETKLEVFNYLLLFSNRDSSDFPVSMEVKAKVKSLNSQFKDLECKLSTKLPNLICEVFI